MYCLIDGNLAEMLKDEGLELPLPQDQSLYLQQILEGVNFLHQSGYLHLDIKGMYSLSLSLPLSLSLSLSLSPPLPSLSLPLYLPLSFFYLSVGVPIFWSPLGGVHQQEIPLLSCFLIAINMIMLLITTERHCHSTSAYGDVVIRNFNLKNIDHPPSCNVCTNCTCT